MKLSLPVFLALMAAVFWAIGTVMLRKTALQEDDTGADDDLQRLLHRA